MADVREIRNAHDVERRFVKTKKIQWWRRRRW